MIGPKLVATSVKHVWAGAVIAIAVLVVAGCDLPGAEHTTLPASPTPAARPAGTRLPPATVTAGASRDASAAASRAAAPAERAVPTPSPVASPETTPLKRAATPAIPGWVAAGATRGAGAVATARAEATEAAAAATRIAIREEEEKKLPSLFSGVSPCFIGTHQMAHYASNDGVRWTADGAHILFTDNGEVWAATPDGSRLWRLAQAWGQAKFKKEDPSPTAFGHATSFDVTPDGNQVVYATCRYPPHWPGVPLAQLNLFDFDYEIAVVGLDGQAPRRLTRQQALDNYPAWSPDGTRIAFLSESTRGGLQGGTSRSGLYTMAADGADVRHLAPDLEGVAWQPPAWSPDGRSIAVAGWRPGDEANGLYLVQADGAGLVRLADAVSGGAWSPDGTRLAFAQPEAAEVGLYTIAADGSDAQRVTTIYGWPRLRGAGSEAGLDSHRGLVAGRIEAPLCVRIPPILCGDARRGARGCDRDAPLGACGCQSVAR